MFVDAFAVAEHFTWPVVISSRRPNGNGRERSGDLHPQVAVSFDPARSAFILDQLQLGLFPIEGILTRLIASAGTPAQFIETSSPGLRGQSWGPSDRDGLPGRLPKGIDPRALRHSRALENLLRLEARGESGVHFACGHLMVPTIAPAATFFIAPVDLLVHRSRNLPHWRRELRDGGGGHRDLQTMRVQVRRGSRAATRRRVCR